MNDILNIPKFKNDISGTNFKDIYKDLLLENQLEDYNVNELKKAFSVALALINFGDNVCEKLGYRIILMYANKYKDYVPLYDYAISKNYVPICKLIERIMKDKIKDDNFNSLFLSAYLENFKDNELYLSQGQKEIINFTKKTADNYVVIAPTSYGKSEIMIRLIKNNLNKKVCILVPTKALIAQTKKRIINQLKDNRYHKIIVHPDMYDKEENFIAVLTQERLLRLLKKNPNLYLDTILVDEAHNLLESGERAQLLAYTLIISKKRNEEVDIKYFTPFLVNANNINIPYLNNSLESIKVHEAIKIERYYYIESNNKSTNISLYDQFFDEFYNVKTLKNIDDIGVVKLFEGNKNILYLNKTRSLEEVADNLSKSNKLIENDDEITDMCKSIEEFLHKDYKLIRCLKHGIVYHHGSVPDIVRLYIEDIFRNNKNIKYIVTSSTLLEGVNIPAEKLFMLQEKKGKSNLSASQFRNLVGRVGRFSEIFNEGKEDLKLLEPNIYIIKGHYMSERDNVKKFIKDCARETKKLKDEKKNILLKNEQEIQDMSDEELDQLENTIEVLENIEPNTIDVNNINYAVYDIGKKCFTNNINEINIIENEECLYKNLNKISLEEKISTCEELIKLIVQIFLDDNISYRKNQNNFIRLKNERAQKFYSMFLDWKCNGSSYKKMIANFIWYWKQLNDKTVFVGSKWGEIKRSESDFIPLYVDTNYKTDYDLVNLAIVRIKEESEFVDNIIIKFVEVINDLNFIENSFYERIKYGSNDPKVICLLKNGYSIELAKCILDKKLIKYVSINIEDNKIIIDPKIISEMEKLKVNKILIFEIKYQANI